MNAQSLAEILSVQLRYTRFVVNANLKGIPDDDHFRAPQAGGNCLNWVLGHLVHARNGWLEMLAQEPAIDPQSVEQYRRGSDAVIDATGTVPPADLLEAFNRSQEPLLAGLAALTDERLSEKAPFSPGNDPEETVGTLCAGLVFHEAYHAGQLGLIRRTLGIRGMIR